MLRVTRGPNLVGADFIEIGQFTHFEHICHP
jgi:hypothetical protein